MADIDDQLKAALANVPDTPSNQPSAPSDGAAPGPGDGSDVDAAIQSALSKIPGPPTPPTADASTPGYLGYRLLSGILNGAKGAGTAAAVDALGIGDPNQIEEQENLPSGNAQAGDWLYGNPNVKEPDNAIAHYGGDVAQAFGTNPVISGLTPFATTAGSVGSTGASDLNKYENSPLPDWLARLFGGVAGGGAYGLGKSIASGAETAPGIAAAKADLANAGAEPVTTADLTGAPQLSAGDRFSDVSPATRQRVAAQTAALQNRAEQVLASADPQTAGQAILDARDAWRKNFNQQAEQAYSDASAKIDPNTNIDTSSVITALTPPAGLSPDVAENAVPSVLDRFKQYFLPDGGQPQTQRSFADMDAIRQQIGRAISNTAEPADRRALGGLYDTVSDAIGDGLGSSGNQAGADAWNDARSAYAAGKQFDEQVLAPFDGKNPEQAYAFATQQLGRGNSRIATLAQQQQGQSAPILNPDQQSALLGAYLRNRASGPDNALDVNKLNALLNGRTKQLAPQSLNTLTANLSPSDQANLAALGRTLQRTQAARTAFGGPPPEGAAAAASKVAFNPLVLANEGGFLGYMLSHENPWASAAGSAAALGGKYAARGAGNLMSTPTGAAIRANMGSPNLLANGALGGIGGENAGVGQGSNPLPGVPMPAYGGDSDNHAAFNDWLNNTDPHIAALHLGQRLGPTVFRELSAAANKGKAAWNAATFQLLSRPDYRKALSQAESE